MGFGPPDSEFAEAERVPLTTIAMPMGLVEGTETVIFMAACLVWPDGLRPLFVGFAALVMLTAIQRAAWAWRALGPE